MRRTSCSAGFTLVEMLVVVAILAILIALLVPLGARGLESSKSAMCRSNQRQLATGVQLYLADHQNTFFPVAWSPSDFPRFWMEAVREYSAHSDEIRMCPSTTSVETHGANFSNLSAWSGVEGSVNWLSNGTRAHKGAYGFNGWLYSTHGYSSTVGNPSWYAKATLTRHHARTPMFGDCTWVDGWPSPHEQLTPGLRGVGAHVAGGSNSTARFGIARHGKAINMTFVDGHCERVPLQDLHQFLWKPNWTPHALALPPM